MQKPTMILLAFCLLLSQSVANVSSGIANTPNTPTPPKSLSGLNRDLSRSTTITKDTQTNALDSSLSIDNRIFSRNGREKIASDIKNFKKNILVSGYGATNTLYNAISTPFQALSNKDISLKDTPTLWKLKQSQQSTALTRSQDDFAKDTLDNLSGGKDTLDIQYALALGISSTEKPSKIYYNPNDEALGFHSTSQATPHQNYLNAASGIITDTNATIFTDAHERAHTYTHSEALANIAGKEAIKAWNIANLIHTSINTNRANTKPSKNLGLSSTNISSNTAYKDISKGVNNITPISQATSQNALDDNNFGDLDLVEHITPKFYLTPKSWLATQSKQSKSTLQSNTYNASLIDSVDRDNLVPIVAAGLVTIGLSDYLNAPTNPNDIQSGVPPTSLVLPIGIASVGAKNVVKNFGNKANTNKSFFSNTHYGDKVSVRMKETRIESDGGREFHNFPELVKRFEKDGNISKFKGGDGRYYERLDIKGGYGSKNGTFEFIKNPKTGEITHRFFNKNK